MGILVLLITAALAQTPSNPMTERAQKKQETRLRKELNGAYTRWVEQDVAYIITDDERRAFQKLQNDEEREQFIEQFWLRRDPTPDTIENEFREEHYRRIAYANQHFASGIAGWRTDRGRIYIAWGPPDQREEHPSGGSYQRTPEEGGGTTSTFPFETWRYRHLEGIDSDITLEFVDKTMSGEYRLTIDPCEKDALAKVPGGAPTPSQPNGLSSCSPSLVGQTEKMNPFRRLELMARVFAPPAMKYNNLPLRVQVSYFPLTEVSVLTYVTLQFENKDLQFVARDGVERATVHILGKVSTMSRRTVMPFEAAVTAETPDRMMVEFARSRSVYNTTLPLAPGVYRLDIAAKDAAGGATTHYEAALNVPRLDTEKLQASSIVLTDVLEKVAARSTGAGQFVIGDLKVRPRVDARFRRDERLGVYCKVYHVRGPARVEYEIVKAGTREGVYATSEDLAGSAEVTIARFFDLRNFAPGAYTLWLKIGETALPPAAFSVF